MTRSAGVANDPAAVGGLLAVMLVSVADDRSAEIEVGGRVQTAVLDDAVSETVLHTALARGERVVAQPEHGAWVILGALRTTPTLGVDDAEEYVVRAGRVRILARHAFDVVTGRASFAMRAAGHVETLAESITTRAASVHRLIGRMLRLN